ncbi:aminopeptidase N-like isoform X2 [Periplaneta americana]|uniref:aminopeptidase N-like isoform X2 n=1 Tax=Periplaneta americana TaxID=6978 RepID=UPI0037E82DD7
MDTRVRRKRMPTSGSRTEFLAVDELGSAGNIHYGRSGGWFVSTKKALLIGLIVISCMVLIGILVHYLGTCKGKPGADGHSEPSSLETTTTAPSGTSEKPIPVADLLLPRDITPSYYRLKLEPYLTELDPDGKNFTYKGHVSIRVSCHNATNKVSLHAKGLNIGKDIKIALYNESTKQTAVTHEITSAMTPTTANDGTTPQTDSITPETTNATSAQVPADTTISPGNMTTPIITTEAQPGGSRGKRNVPAIRRRAPIDPPSQSGDETTKSLRISERVQEDEKDKLTLTVEPGLKAGQTYVLDIPFSGELAESLFGFYRSSYKDANDNTVWMATTQFEAPHAREAFPCFDEPSMKARFEISISRNANMTTISNMLLRASQPVDGQAGRVWDHYEVTPVMSTYLVAFIVAPSDFVPTDSPSTPGNKSVPEFKVFARKQLAEHATYAATIGPRVLQYYEDYFGIPYPLPKMHMAAIPDFAAGAMENWGLITYRESSLLYDPKSSSMSNKDRVSTVVAHELAHQWFGNLVTMKWWNDLWLNEGFATYMEYVGANHVEPTWQMLEKFVFYEQHYAMALDCLKSTHPVSIKVDNPSQISEIFDSISYSKGASLIRMLNNSLTEDVLRKGLSRYLNKWKYNNAEESDLWQALTEQTRETPDSFLPVNATVKEIMDTWTLQDGYPVLTVTRDYNYGSATLSQVRFTLDNSSTDTLWYMPVSYATQEELNGTVHNSSMTFPRIWLKTATKTISNLTEPKSYDSWVLFNIESTGYYLVNYDVRNWELIAEHLLHSSPETTFSVLTRTQLLNDALYLARAGKLDYDVALNVTRYLATREEHYVPWRAALQNFDFLNTVLRETTVYGKFQMYMIKMLKTIKMTLGFEPKTDEPQPRTLLRPKILSWLSKMDDPDVVLWAKNLFQQWRNSTKPDENNPIPVDMRDVVYCTAVKAGGLAEWDFVLQRYLAAKDKPSESDVLLVSLACTKQEWLLVTLLEKTLQKNGEIRLQDTIRVWGVMPTGATSSRIAFNYVRNNWATIHEKAGKDEFLIGRMIKGAISGLTTELDSKDVEEFHKANKGKFTFVERKMKQEMEALQLRVAWHKNYYATIATWLENFHDSK